VSAEVVNEIQRILRKDLLLGSDRPILPDATLAEVGLDSLAIINLITALEAAYHVEIAEKVQIAQPALKLREIAALVENSPRVNSATPRPAIAAHAFPPLGHRIELLENEFAGRGPLRATTWAVLRLVWPWLAALFTPPAEYVLLERPLANPAPIHVPIPPDVELRTYSPTDRDALEELWPLYLARNAGSKVDLWLSTGARADVAVQGRRIVGLSIVSATGEPGEVVVEPARRACWGIYLREAPDARGRGIGIALLAQSLAESQARGFSAQMSSVRVNNAPMLLATTQLLGFRPIGRATRMRILGVTRWSWEVQGRPGKGSKLVL